MAWTRHGECNNCGHCCQTFTRDIVVRDMGTVADQAFYQARGFRPVTIDGQPRIILAGWMAAPCPEHTPTGCRIYSERPGTCQAFPTSPADVVQSPCSYWFSDGANQVGGDGSPYPARIEQLMAIEQE